MPDTQHNYQTIESIHEYLKGIPVNDLVAGIRVVNTKGDGSCAAYAFATQLLSLLLRGQITLSDSLLARIRAHARKEEVMVAAHASCYQHSLRIMPKQPAAERLENGRMYVKVSGGNVQCIAKADDHEVSDIFDIGVDADFLQENLTTHFGLHLLELAASKGLTRCEEALRPYIDRFHTLLLDPTLKSTEALTLELAKLIHEDTSGRELAVEAFARLFNPILRHLLVEQIVLDQHVNYVKQAIIVVHETAGRQDVVSSDDLKDLLINDTQLEGPQLSWMAEQFQFYLSVYRVVDKVWTDANLLGERNAYAKSAEYDIKIEPSWPTVLLTNANGTHFNTALFPDEPSISEIIASRFAPTFALSTNTSQASIPQSSSSSYSEPLVVEVTHADIARDEASLMTSTSAENLIHMNDSELTDVSLFDDVPLSEELSEVHNTVEVVPVPESVVPPSQGGNAHASFHDEVEVTSRLKTDCASSSGSRQHLPPSVLEPGYSDKTADKTTHRASVPLNNVSPVKVMSKPQPARLNTEKKTMTDSVETWLLAEVARTRAISSPSISSRTALPKEKAAILDFTRHVDHLTDAMLPLLARCAETIPGWEQHASKIFEAIWTHVVVESYKNQVLSQKHGEYDALAGKFDTVLSQQLVLRGLSTNEPVPTIKGAQHFFSTKKPDSNRNDGDNAKTEPPKTQRPSSGSF